MSGERLSGGTGHAGLRLAEGRYGRLTTRDLFTPNYQPTPMPIKNYTTSIATDKTIMEIQTALRKAGASAVLVEYDTNGNISTVNFKLRMTHGEVAFRLPGRVDGVLETLKRQRVEKRHQTREQAERVAWRIVKDWITAQLAIVEAEIADMAEVFLPYADAGNGGTVYQLMLSNPNTLLRLPG